MENNFFDDFENFDPFVNFDPSGSGVGFPHDAN
jgi:hypothetical protein